MNTIFSLDAWLWSRCDRPTSMDRYFLHSATKSRCEVRWLTGQLRASCRSKRGFARCMNAETGSCAPDSHKSMISD